MLREVTLPSGEQRQIDCRGKIYTKEHGVEYTLPRCYRDLPVVKDGCELFWSVRDAAEEMRGISGIEGEIVKACRRIRDRKTGRVAGHSFQWLDEWLREQLGMEVED